MFDRKIGGDFLYVPQNPKETILQTLYTYIEIFYVMIISGIYNQADGDGLVDVKHRINIV